MAGVGIPAKCPQVVIERQAPLVVVAEHAGLDDIPFESEEFNRLFRVGSKDRRFATAFIDPRIMEWLLTTRGDFGAEVHLQAALVYSQFIQPREVPLLLDGGRVRAARPPGRDAGPSDRGAGGLGGPPGRRRGRPPAGRAGVRDLSPQPPRFPVAA